MSPIGNEPVDGRSSRRYRRTAEREQATNGAWRIVGTNVVSKVIVMAVAGVVGLFTTRLILQNFGVQAYAQYGLLNSMGALVPFADLGMAAAIINAVGNTSSPKSDPVFRRTLTSAFRLLLASAGVIIAIGLLISAFGLWELLLGDSLTPGGAYAALACTAVFALTLPLGVGQRILTGLGKNHLQVLVQALAAPLIFSTVVILIAVGGSSGSGLAVITYSASLVVAAVTLVMAARFVRPQVSAALVRVPFPRRHPGEKIMGVAFPMLAQMIALPLAMQTDRLLLSHLSTPSDLAQYNLGAQLFGTITQMIGTAGIALWPIFARARRDSAIASPFGLVGGFVAGGVLLASILAVLTPWLVPLASGGRVQLNGWIIAGFIAFTAAQAAKYPLGMYMTDRNGLRFQVIPIFIMVPVNLVISWALIPSLGAAGPILGSAIAVTLCQVIPNVFYVRRDLKLRKAALVAAE